MSSRSLLHNSYFLLLAATAALLPTYLIRFSILGIPTNVLEIAIGFLFLLGLARAGIRQQWREAWRAFPGPLAILIGLFFIACVISTIVSPHLHTSLGILKGWIIVPMVFGWIVYASKPQKLEIKKLRNWKLPITDYRLLITSSLILSGIVVALFGISQIGTLDRVRSIYDVPNSLALFLAPLIVMATWLAAMRSRFTDYYILAALIMFIALLATQSVMGVSSVILVLALGLLFFRPYSLRLTAYGFGALIAILLLSFIILKPKIEYLLQPGSSYAVRLQLWSVSWDLIKEHPLLGIGLGTFEPAYQQKLHQRFQEFENCSTENSLKIVNCKLKIQTRPLSEFVFRDPHNWLLSFWLNTGLLGLLSFIGIHLYVFKRVYQLQITNYKLQAVILALAVLLLYGLTDTIYWKNDLAVLQWILISSLGLFQRT